MASSELEKMFNSVVKQKDGEPLTDFIIVLFSTCGVILNEDYFSDIHRESKCTCQFLSFKSGKNDIVDAQSY